MKILKKHTIIVSIAVIIVTVCGICCTRLSDVESLLNLVVNGARVPAHKWIYLKETPTTPEPESVEILGFDLSKCLWIYSPVPNHYSGPKYYDKESGETYVSAMLM